uniref:Cyclin-dependent kinase 7 n=1 Tax=Steinernema glaseri TaxID=37863 RepID=A0A1I8ARG5_9BILA
MKDKKDKRYEIIQHLGEGQFANVYKAKDNETGIFVAIKKIKLSSRSDARDGVNRTAVREIKLLRELKHDNIIGLLDVIGHKTNIQLVFDFMETDLEHLVKNQTLILTLPHIKNMVMQMLLGLEYLHIHWMLHRDLKPNNLLMNSIGRIKLADFGLARFFGSPNRPLTHQVVTRWYRAPELLYGARAYGTGVDMWAIGCIIGELLLRVPIFPGETDIDQLVKIYNILGTPTEEQWPDIKELNDYVKMKETKPQDLGYIFSAATQDLIELLSMCLHFNPLRRWTATQALSSAYFKSQPYACNDCDLPLPGGAAAAAAQRKRRNLAGADIASVRRRLEF